MSKKEYPKSPAQVLFEGKKIITERPEEMTYDEYRVVRSYQSKILSILTAKSPNPKIAAAMGVRYGYNQHV